MILTGVDERADVRDERADVVRDLVAANAVAVGHVVAGKLGEVRRERLTSRVLVQARR